MMLQRSRRSPRPVWAYTYRINRPRAAPWLAAIRTIVDQENVEARAAHRAWTGCVVLEGRGVTCILVLSDGSNQRLDVNRRLEFALNRHNAEFRLTSPMAISQDRERPSPDPRLIPSSDDRNLN